MKTHEIVAVKVVKNKPAYFNQSMMEVTILELVGNELLADLVYTNNLLVAEQNLRPERRASHTPATGFIHTSTTSLSRLRIAVIEPVRIDQTESVPRLEHTARQGVYGAAFGCSDNFEGRPPHPLRSQTRKYPS